MFSYFSSSYLLALTDALRFNRPSDNSRHLTQAFWACSSSDSSLSCSMVAALDALFRECGLSLWLGLATCLLALLAISQLTKGNLPSTFCLTSIHCRRSPRITKRYGLSSLEPSSLLAWARSRRSSLNKACSSRVRTGLMKTFRNSSCPAKTLDTGDKDFSRSARS